MLFTTFAPKLTVSWLTQNREFSEVSEFKEILNLSKLPINKKPLAVSRWPLAKLTQNREFSEVSEFRELSLISLISLLTKSQWLMANSQWLKAKGYKL